jgi:UDP-glucose 4-epimerase
VKVIVTGSHGFIGKHLVRFLKQKSNYEILEVDLKGGMDLLQSSTIKTIKEFKPDVVFHLASHNDVHESMKNANKYMQNVTMTINLLKAIPKIQAKIIFTSSCAVYGEHRNAREGSSTIPLNIYGYSKLFAEILITSQQPNYIILRLGNVYGAGSKGYITKIPKMEKPRIYVPTIYRDFIHVNDVVQILYEAMINNVQGIYNIGTGSAISYLTIVKFLKKGYYTEPRPYYIPCWCTMDCSRMKETFKTLPQINTLFTWLSERMQK